jgi:hypothetical protein
MVAATPVVRSAVAATTVAEDYVDSFLVGMREKGFGGFHDGLSLRRSLQDLHNAVDSSAWSTFRSDSFQFLKYPWKSFR